MGIEMGIMFFEQFLVFVEVDVVISSQFGWGFFVFNVFKVVVDVNMGIKIVFICVMIMKCVNIFFEVLLVIFILIMSYVISYILGLLNLQLRFCLISIGFYGFCLMGCMVWSIINFFVDDFISQGLLRYFMVYIIGIIFYIFILIGIIFCVVIYFVVLIFFVFVVFEVGIGGEMEQFIFKQCFFCVYVNMQVNVLFFEIWIRMDMDFYIVLVWVGFGVIIMVSEVVYFNEDYKVNLKWYIWLEEDWFCEIEDLKMQWIGGVFGFWFDMVGMIGFVLVKNGQLGVNNGYVREKLVQQVFKKDGIGRRQRDGVGVVERSFRWFMVVDYMMYILCFVVVIWVLCMVRFFRFVGWRNLLCWLRGLFEWLKKLDGWDKKGSLRQNGELYVDIFFFGNGGYFMILWDDQVDVEELFRSRMDNCNEVEVDIKFYSYFLWDGWWGNKDISGEYVFFYFLIMVGNEEIDVNDFDFDMISMIFMIEIFIESDFGWEIDNDNNNDWFDDGQ